MPVQTLILLASLSLLGAFAATAAGSISATATVPVDDAGGGSPTVQ